MAVDFDELVRLFGDDKAKAAAFLAAFRTKFESDPATLTRKNYQDFITDYLKSSDDGKSMALHPKLRLWGETAFGTGESKDWPKWDTATWGEFGKKVADTLLVWGEKAKGVGQGAVDAFNSGAIMNAAVGLLIGLAAVFPMKWFVEGAFTSATDIIPVPSLITTVFSLMVAVPAAAMIGLAFGKTGADGLRGAFEWAKEKGRGLFASAPAEEPEKAAVAAVEPERAAGFTKVASVSAVVPDSALDCARKAAAGLPKGKHADPADGIALACISKGDARALTRLI